MPKRVSDDAAAAAFRAAGFEPVMSTFVNGSALTDGVWLACGHVRPARLRDVKNSGVRCGDPTCARRRLSEARSIPPSLAEAEFLVAGFVADITRYVDAKTPCPGVWVDCGHPRPARLAGVRIGQGCGHTSCRTEKSAEGRRLSSEEAERQFRNAGFVPQMLHYVDASTGCPGRWISCGHPGRPSLSSIKAPRGCRSCSYERRGMTHRVPPNEALLRFEAAGYTPDMTKYRSAGEDCPGRWHECGHADTVSLAYVQTSRRCMHRLCAFQRRSLARRTPPGEADTRFRALGFVPDLATYVNGGTPCRGKWTICCHTEEVRLEDLTQGRLCGDTVCANKRRVLAYRTPPEAAFKTFLSAGFVPDMTRYESGSLMCPGKWLTCGHDRPTSLHVLRAGHRCSHTDCVARALSTANRLTEKYVLAAFRTYGFEPDMGAYVDTQHRCPGMWLSCGHRGEPRLHHVSHGVGCATCAPHGYDASLPGFLYLMRRHGEQQVGLTNNPKVRRYTHGRPSGGGWDAVEFWGPMDGFFARMEERKIKRWLREKIGTLPGSTEKWTTSKLCLTSLRDLADVVPDLRFTTISLSPWV